jgi:hypothetical protein
MKKYVYENKEKSQCRGFLKVNSGVDILGEIGKMALLWT